MPSRNPHGDHEMEDVDELAILDPEEAGEEIPDDPDAPMESDDEIDPEATIEEIQLVNDSVAHFDGHKDSIFCIAQHPAHSEIVATGGGDDLGYIFDSTPPPNPVLPPSYESNPQPIERESLKPIFKLEGHTDSINAITFTLPEGQYIVTTGLDGRLRVWTGDRPGRRWKFLAEAQEVEEINWVAPCPHPSYPNTIALGANDGSVWVYTINAADKASPLNIVQTFYVHTESCTAGAWSPDGKLLATVSEDASFYVWDVFGEAAAAGITNPSGGQSLVGLTAQDERFRVDGGLYSVAVAPNGTFASVGGAEGHIRIIGLPKIGVEAPAASGARRAGGRNRPGGGRQAGTRGGAVGASSGQGGQILASLKAQSDGVETIAFSEPPLTLMASGSVDGSIALFDTAHRFAVRRHIKYAHGEDEEDEGAQAVIKVEFVRNSRGTGTHLLTSCGNDGVVRRWDARGGTAAAARGLVKEWRGHRGGGEGGGVLGFVQGDGERIITAGDDGVSLVLAAPIP